MTVITLYGDEDRFGFEFGWYETASRDPKGLDALDVWIEAFNRHEADALARMYADDAVLESPDFDTPKWGREAIADHYRDLFRRSPDAHKEITNQGHSANQAYFEYGISGTVQASSQEESHKAEGWLSPVKMCSVIELERARIVRETIYQG